MRSVIGALLLQGSRGLSTRVDVRPRAFLRARPASTAAALGADRALGTRCRRAALRPRCCLGLERENPFRTAGKMDKPLRCWLLDSQRDQEARSVVALSRVPR